MAESIIWTFAFTCPACGEEVQVIDGQQEEHPCPQPDVPAISGCDPWVEFDQLHPRDWEA